MAVERASKSCVVCGRAFTWRKKWAREWDNIRHCSQRCRRSGVTPLDQALQDTIVALLEERARGATICPSEVARAVAGSHGTDGEDWRHLMGPTRAAARRLVVSGDVVITQKSRVVDPSTAKGPIRIRRVRP